MKTLARALALAAFASAAVTGIGAATPPPATAEPGWVPCKIHQKDAAIFPVRLMHDGVVSGEVQLMLEVDPEGKLSDTLLVAYTHRDFADEALRVVKKWRFEPGLIEGRPIISILNFTFNFEVAGVVVYERRDPPSRNPQLIGEKFEYQPHGLAALDRQPIALSRPGPAYPQVWAEQGRSGTVLVDFFIDESGRVRIPLAAEHADEYLASAAIAAVRQWRFEPPTRHGRPVLVRAQQVFMFQPEPKPGSSA